MNVALNVAIYIRCVQLKYWIFFIITFISIKYWIGMTIFECSIDM